MRNQSVQFLEEWLSQHELDELLNHGIRFTSDSRFPGLYCLKYGPTADKSSRIVQVCRGAVVEDWFGSWQVVSYAFDRFFNFEEPYAPDIDWGSARVYEKYDGSLIKLFNWRGSWLVSTSGTVGGDVAFGPMPMTFEQLFWSTFDKVGYAREDLDPRLVYVFELCTPHNRVVVNHKVERLPLLAVRDAMDMTELPPERCQGQFQIASHFKMMRDMEAVLRVAEQLKGSEHEGFVIVDKHFNRLKVKGRSYVQMHRAKGNGDPSFFELWKNDDLVEFWTYFPEFKDEFQRKLARVEDVAFFVEGFVREYSHMDQKTFAAQVLHHHPKVSSAMFAIRACKADGFISWLQEQNEKKFEEIFGE